MVAVCKPGLVWDRSTYYGDGRQESSFRLVWVGRARLSSVRCEGAGIKRDVEGEKIPNVQVMYFCHARGPTLLHVKVRIKPLTQPPLVLTSQQNVLGLRGDQATEPTDEYQWLTWLSLISSAVS